jgi:hypothetical protein
VRGAKATVFVIEGDKARLLTAAVKGEDAGRLFLDPAALLPGARVVVEGRALLVEGDRVEVKLLPDEAPAASAAPSAVKEAL